MEKDAIKTAAKKSFIALKDPYHSVEKVYPNIIDDLVEDETFYYTGVKNVPQIPSELLTHLKKTGNYLLHTIDHSSIGGRAVDMHRSNPISGRPMTGSSSGTAINVLLGINDLGIGTDGGGSVLAPAMSVNLYSFISKRICPNHLKTTQSQSTDDILFSPSIGFITRTFREMKRVVSQTIDLPAAGNSVNKIGVLEDLSAEINEIDAEYIQLKAPNTLGPRKPLIEFLEKELQAVDFILSEEGPIDYDGLGDSVLGHFDTDTKNKQEKSNKGLIRVVNMAGATAITIPTKSFASAYVLICESDSIKISHMLEFAEELTVPADELIERYFRNFEHYFPEGYLG